MSTSRLRPTALRNATRNTAQPTKKRTSATASATPAKRSGSIAAAVAVPPKTTVPIHDALMIVFGIVVFGITCDRPGAQRAPRRDARPDGRSRNPPWGAPARGAPRGDEGWAHRD